MNARKSSNGSSGIQLSDEQRLDWLRLIRSENVGPRAFRSLLNHYGGARAALDALPELARRGGAAQPGRITTRERPSANSPPPGVWACLSWRSASPNTLPCSPPSPIRHRSLAYAAKQKR